MVKCEIEHAVVELESGAGDGCYDLLDVTGTPEKIGKAIAESLSECDLCTGDPGTAKDRGEALYVTVRIKVTQVSTCDDNELMLGDLSHNVQSGLDPVFVMHIMSNNLAQTVGSYFDVYELFTGENRSMSYLWHKIKESDNAEKTNTEE